jgi:hypothetical protein
MKIPQMQCSPDRIDCDAQIWLVVIVGDKRLVGKRKAGTFRPVGLGGEDASEESHVIVGEEL